MKAKTARIFSVLLVWFLLSLLVIGCGGSNSSKKAGSFISPKQSSVDAVLQQKKAEADRNNGTINAGKETEDKQKYAGKNTGEVASGIQSGQGVGALVSSQKMKELEEKTPRASYLCESRLRFQPDGQNHDVYPDLQYAEDTG